MRHNILAWLESTGPSADHVIVLTHNIDFLFLEAVLLPKLRAIGDPSLTIFADSASAAATFKTQAPLIWELGKRYRVIPVDLGPWRRFHPKAILVSSRDGAQLAIGSGNLTAGGWSGNFEVWATYSSDAEGLPVLASFADVLNGLPQLVAMPERTDASLTSVTSSSWFSGLPAPDGLLYSLRRPLLDQIAEVLPEPASEVWIISPYFDPTLTALREFADRVGAPIKVLAQPLRAGITGEMADSLPSTTGMRLSEQYSLAWGQVHLDRRTIDLTKTKNGSVRTVHLNADAVAALKTLQKKQSKPTDMVFPRQGPRFDTRSWFVPCLEDAQISGYVWHSNRHTFCSWLAMAGASIKEIQELAGHKTITMSARYSHLSPEHRLSVIDRISSSAG